MNTHSLAVTRRSTVLGLTALAISSHAALSKTDEGHNGAIIKPRYTYSTFERLDKPTISALYHKNKYKFVVDGFSPKMSRTLVGLLFNEQRSGQRLLRDMAKIKGKNPRINRITKEIVKYQQLEQKLWKSVQRLEKKKGGLSKLALVSEKSRLNRTIFTIRYLKQWQASPMEGTR